jgi:hypothetical protein
MIWGTVETSVTICAASVPFLRVLIKEVTSYPRYQVSDGGYQLSSRPNKDTTTSSRRKSNWNQKELDESMPDSPATAHRRPAEQDHGSVDTILEAGHQQPTEIMYIGGQAMEIDPHTKLHDSDTSIVIKENKTGNH